MQLAVNVLHYGSVCSTLQCLESLCDEIASQPCPVSCIIVPSNGTEIENDAIFEWANKHFEQCHDVCNDSGMVPSNEKKRKALESSVSPSFILIRNHTNKGFAAGHNPGISLAMTLGVDAVWLLNNDSIIQPYAIKELEAAYLLSGGNKVLGTTVIESDDPTVLQCAGGMKFCAYSTRVTAPLQGQPVNQVDQLMPPAFDYIYGASFFVPVKIFREVGLLTEDFFLFYEELDFCNRAKAAGYKVDWCRKAIVLHRSEGQKGDSAVRVFHDIRSFTIFAQKYYSKVWIPMALTHGLGRCILQLVHGEFANVTAVFRGLYSGFSFSLK